MTLNEKTLGKSCFYCQKRYPTEQEARECEKTHHVYFLPLMKEDLNLLAHYIMTGNRELLTERLSKTILRHFRGNKNE